MLTLLGGAEYTLVNWEHGLSDISRVLYDIMLKDMCQARELDSQTTAECVTQDRSLAIN